MCIRDRTRILFNDEMKSFSLKGTNIYNQVEKRKRPKTAMCPAIILDAHREVVMVIGASGAALIPSATAYLRAEYRITLPFRL